MVSTRQKIVLAFAILILFNLLLVMIFGDDGLVDLNHLKAEKRQLEQKNDQINRENSGLYREIDRLKHDREYIEDTARKELGVIAQDEVIFKIKPEAEKRKP